MNIKSEKRKKSNSEQENKNSLCPNLPLLNYLQNELGSPNKSLCGLFGVQHIFGSTATLVHKLAEHRLQSEGVFLLGKPYSTNRMVMEHLKTENGFYLHPESAQHPLEKADELEMHRKIEWLFAFCRRWLNNPSRSETDRMLLIDDGGQAIRMLHTPLYADIVDRFTCVEQTRRGIRQIENLELRVPVVNVAESWVKLDYESPLIAESVKTELLKQLELIQSRGISSGKNALVIGYGAIGKAVGGELRRCGFNVTVFDQSDVKRNLAINDNYPIYEDLHEALHCADTIIGCTGISTLDYADYEHINDGAMLVSTSSSDVEFKSWQLRSEATSLGTPQYWNKDGVFPDKSTFNNDCLFSLEPDHPCFSLYRVKNNNKCFYLINGGFPINFNGDIDPIAPHIIQLTRGLLYAGAVQASYESRPGLHPFSDEIQNLLLNEYVGYTKRFKTRGVV